MMDANRVIDFVNGTSGAEMLPYQERLVAALVAARNNGKRLEISLPPRGRARFTVPPAIEAHYRGRSI